jgi:lipid II:glycine glycyltransferase (peptidoglycan interpeptide bridge formation enzyme)
VQTTFEQTVSALNELGKKTRAVFVRWTPPRKITNSPALAGSRLPLKEEIKERDKSQIPNLKGIDIVEPKILVHQVPPKATLVIDLAKNEEVLLQEMHEKTRYNIRLAERKGVVAQQVSVQEGFEKFWALMRDTARRDAIGIHAKAYYRKMLEIAQGEEPTTHLFLAQLADAPLAAALLVVSGDTATYLHGGSSSAQRNLMAPYVLQWRMMQFARARGMRWYDMWGIAPSTTEKLTNRKTDEQNRHPWAGITRFKMGFGGEVREGAGTFDIVCRQVPYRVLSLGRLLKDLIV